MDANPNRVATQEEQSVLARYVGWGGLAQAFDANNKDWSREHAELRELLNDDEYADAARSTRYAHYTSREVVVDGVYAAMRRFGFTGGKTLEAGAGVGNFLGLMPADMRSAGRFTAIERDRLSSTIARHLYPQQNVQRADFTQFKGADGYFDAAVGNPPFASDTQTDQSGRKHLSGLSLHNYFFAKAVDMLRPGGVMAQVVTSSFLDAKGDAARRYIGERTVFLGAIRLPNNAFSKNAGTEVTTDIIFLQKRADADIGSKKAKQEAKAWQDTAEFTDASGKKVPLNQYFIDHPNMMLGDFGAHGTMYGPDQPALVARPGQDTAALLREAVQRLPEGVYTPAAAANTASQHKAAMEALKNPAVQEGGYFIDGDRLMRREQDVAGEAFAVQITPEMPWTEKQALGQTRFDRIRGLAQLRVTTRALIAAEMRNDEQRMEVLRADLNAQYDEFQRTQGFISSRANQQTFGDDPDYPLLLALEQDYNPGISVPAAKAAGVKPVKPSAKKSPIFSRRVVAAREAVRKVDSPIDALAVSMAERGRLDAAYIGQLLGRDPQDVLNELASGEKPAIFRDPATDEYVLRDAYLSGNVRAKLAQAIAAGERTNIRALEEVQPEDVPASEIVARIGSPWVPKSVYEDFARHLFGDETEANVRYIKENGSFIAAITPGNAVANTSTYGTPKMDGSAILQALLNNRPVRVTFRDSEGKTHVDQEGTDQANEKAQAIRDKFQDWLFADGDRAEVLVRAYNDTNNNYVTRVYDGERMTFPGKVPDEIVKFRRHQRNAIARTVQDRTALYDHVVGSGKTFTVIASAMELRRTGLAKKPMIAVPNHLVKQWAADFYRLYPGANILTATKDDFKRQNRRKFLAKAATGDWDAIIIAHSSFGFIRSAPEFEEQFNRKEIAKIVAAIESVEADADSDKQQKRRTVKQLEGLKERLENRIKSLRDRPMDDLLDFDQLGVDQLFVDEFHLFKNLMFSTKMQNVQGLGDPTGSQRAYDMLLKIGQIFAKNGRDQGFVAATGTPVSNSLAEMYHMMRYLMPTQMEALGFTSFDAWANTFASVEQVWMQKPSAEGFKASSRMSTFVNTPELLKMFDQVSDTVTMDNIKAAFAEENGGAEFPLPKIKGGRRTPISLEKTPAQEAYMKELAERAKVVEARKGPPEKGEDNVLVIMSDGRKAAMDIRLVDADRVEREPGGRVDRASDEIMARYRQYAKQKGTQLVFSDLGTPVKHAKAELKEYQALRDRIDAADDDVRASAALGDEDAMDKLQDADAAQEELDAKGPDWLDAVRAAERGFSVYDDLRAALIEKGVPPQEIAFIHDANTDEQKAALFRKVNSGEVRVLMGSTQKMGAGTNVQERLVALHHLDVPWKPSDVEQREGRIERQGNKLAFGPEALPGFEVEILGYVTQDTLDMRMWQIQETKLKMINQLRTRNVARELDNAFEDMEMSAGEMQAAATGNMDLLKEIQLRSDVKKLEQRKRAFDASRADLESRRRRNAQQLQSLPGQIDAARAPGDKVAAYRKEADARLADFKANIDGKDYTDWREAQAYLREHDDRRIKVKNDQGEMVEKAAPLDVTINGERYTARAAMADAFSQLRGDVDPIIWSVGDNTMRRRTEIERAIRQPVVDAIADQNEQRAGSIAGFDVVIEGHVTANGNQLDVALMDGGTAVDQRQFTVSDSGRAPAQVIKSVEGMLNSMQHAVSDLEARLKRAKKEAADLDGTAAVGEWPDAEKLEKARAAHREVLKRLAGESQAAEPVKDGGDNFGARRRAAQGTPTDRAVMDMLREGREAKDVLRLIAGTSKSRFNRQIARLLIRTGISPTMEALPGAGLGYDKRGFALLAKFNRSSNTVTLTDGAGYMAEQIVLHEIVHAATLAALDRKGLHSLQMRRLFEHVRKHGGLAGTYGMKNVGEFTSEAFTNPDFQRELRKIKGVQDGGAIKTAWDGFIRILCSILGLRNDSTDALSQALQIGVAVMRDQYRMGNRGERGGHNAYMATRNVAGQDSAPDDSDAHMGAPTHGYLDGKPHNPPTEQLSAEQRKMIVDTFNANTSGEKVTTTGAVESSGDIGAKSRAFQALAAAEGWTVHRDQIGAKYFNVNKGGRDGINIAVRVSDHSNVNRGIHFKESAINLAPNDGWAAFDDFESALWKLRNAGEDEDGNLTFGGDEPDYFFGAADVRELKDSAMQRVTDAFTAEGTVSLWHKTVGTMRNLAERSPAFKPVFEAAQRFIDDVALMANDAADRAPRVLPRVDTWRDLAKKPISAADNKAIAKPLFEGTLLWARDEQKKPVLVADLQKRYASKTADEKAQLMLRAGTLDPKVLRMWQGMQKDQFDKIINSRFESEILKAGVVWSDKELETIFSATPNQISLYRETRAAVDRSIDMTARADMLRALGEEFADLRDKLLEQDSLGDAMEFLIAEIRKRSDAAPDQGDRFMALHNAVVDRATKARDLMDAGYMPLSRFGQYTVDVVGEDGERLFFGMYESKGDANRARVALATEFKGATITQGTMSQQDYKLFAGITPESLELFGNMLGLEGDGDKARDAAFQEYLQRAKANQSALKRLIHRQGIAGFSEDVGRVLASFVYSNARLAAGGMNAGTMDKAISNIPKREGELRDVAMGLRDYIKDPQEEGQAIRGMLFAQYLGGSVASAFVNMTQPFAVTIPWLSQYGGIKAAGAQMTRALNDMRRSFTDKGFRYEPDLAAALQSAQDDGVVSPQEIHQLMAQARGTGSLRVGDGTRTGDARAAAANAWERTKVAWGQPFALAEQFNRRSTFIAAYRTAKERGMRDPAEFARRAVLETQFLYSKASKPRWARGTVGGTLFTFKTYSVSYLELMNRMWTQGGPEGKRAVGWMLASLMLMGGAGGLPFMEDLEDLIDGVAQLMGINISTKQQRQRALRAVLGKEIADFMEQGVSGLPGAPVDVSGRLGMGNLLPGTGLFMTKQSRERDLLEVVGPAGDLVARGFSGGRKLLTGDFGGAAMEVAPTAVRNIAKGADMAATGIYKDTKGYKVIDTTMLEAAAKAVGFQPRSVAEVQEANSFMMRSRSFYTQTSAEIKAQWAAALFNKDDAALARVRERLDAWNRNNPDQRITVRMPDIWKRVREMGKDRTQRIAETAPKALRQQMREMAAEAG